jgi:hypothetical protein
MFASWHTRALFFITPQKGRTQEVKDHLQEITETVRHKKDILKFLRVRVLVVWLLKRMEVLSILERVSWCKSELALFFFLLINWN